MNDQEESGMKDDEDDRGVIFLLEMLDQHFRFLPRFWKKTRIFLGILNCKTQTHKYDTGLPTKDEIPETTVRNLLIESCILHYRFQVTVNLCFSLLNHYKKTLRDYI